MSSPTDSADNSLEGSSPTQRVAVYVDGLNLFYGLKSRNWRRYYWLDLHRLAESLLRPGQSLAIVRYFTARVEPRSDDPEQHVRQDTYLQALATRSELTIQYGHHLPKSVTCQRCGATRQTFEEKMTDVNIAVELLGDAQDDIFDTAIIVSADSDLIGPISAIRRRYADKRVVVAFPPNRASKQLRGVASATFTLGRKLISDSQLPPQVIKPNGYPLRKPDRWN